MDFKNRLILFFILIAIIPIIALSAVSTVTIIKFKDQIANIYSGYVTNVELLSKNKGDLLGMRSDLIQFASSQDPAQKKAGISHMILLKNGIASTAGSYKTIQDLPGDFLPAQGVDLSKISADETVLVETIGQQWEDYSSRVEDLAILSTDPSFAPQAQAEALQLVAQTDRLVSSYDDLLAIDAQIGEASRAQSQQVMQLAFFYGGLASAISAACATAAAILISKRVVLGDLVRMTKLELVETTLRDLIGGGSDALLQMVKSQMQEGGAPRTVVADVPSAVVPSASEDDVVIGKKKAKAFIEDDDPAAAAGKPTWAFAEDNNLKPAAAAAGKTKAFADDNDENLPAPKQQVGDYKGKLVLLNASRFGHAAKALEGLLASQNTIVLTRKGSNIYYRALQGKGKPRLYILQSVAAVGGAKEGGGRNEEGSERVILSDNEERIAREIESITRENPGSTVLIDSATELIYMLGFEKAFSLLRRVSETVSSYEGAGAVVLVNAKAHEPRIMEAISNIANDFVD
ncbi:MCP four helix bundle domain-containing protein [Nitrososphaera viennensis]|uniref:MCP four helix bundle domain-containing protein n=1 Tax=Nitrososphaera viennensis TaxID=1034015 RepID=A0A977IBM9_9ARCH|nr:MCP four helix bundle domain-containing protein [Nitrososphaera viennensis]UVS67994.1 MCP four helix bundle domain-containing protein [Nitrososphaera viennensis]